MLLNFKKEQEKMFVGGKMRLASKFITDEDRASSFSVCVWHLACFPASNQEKTTS